MWRPGDDLTAAMTKNQEERPTSMTVAAARATLVCPRGASSFRLRQTANGHVADLGVPKRDRDQK